MRSASAPLAATERVKVHIPGPGEFPTGLELPWAEPLEQWEHPSLVRVTRGISRNVVRFVGYRDAVYAVKELEKPTAQPLNNRQTQFLL